MTNVSKTLEERGARYGEFIDHATIAQGIQEVYHEAPNWWRLKPDVRQMLIVLSDKVARILNGDPDYTDNYHDIQGYAKLVEDRLLREEKANDAKNAKLFEEDKEQLTPLPRGGITMPDSRTWIQNDKANDPNYDVGNYRG